MQKTDVVMKPRIDETPPPPYTTSPIKNEIFSTPLHSLVYDNQFYPSYASVVDSDDEKNMFHSIESTPGSYRGNDESDDRFISCKSLNT